MLPLAPDDPQRVNYERATNLKLRGASMTKPPLGIVPMRGLVGVSRVLEDGYVHYAPGNWAEQPLDAAAQAYDNAEQRHRAQSQPLNGLMTPESLATIDPDSGLPHIDHQIAGLVILRSLMIRDGVLPEDPGMGKRKRARLDDERAREASYHMGTAPGDAPSLDERKRTRETQCTSSECAIRNTCTGSGACPKPVDPDAARRAAADANVEQIKRDAAKLADSKREWDQRCLECAPWRGLAKVGYTVEDAEGAAVHVQCKSCKGTGLRTGAEGVSW